MSRGVPVSTMIEQLDGLRDTKDLNAWEQQFVTNVLAAAPIGVAVPGPRFFTIDGDDIYCAESEKQATEHYRRDTGDKDIDLSWDELTGDTPIILEGIEDDPATGQRSTLAAEAAEQIRCGQRMPFWIAGSDR